MISAMIRKIHIFAGLSEEALDALYAACRESRAEKGRIVVREDTPGTEMYVIGEGRVEVVKSAGGAGEKVLATLGPGEVFGEMSLIECMIRSASIRCLEPCTLYSLRSGDLLQVFQRWPDQYALLMVNIARDLSRRLRAMDAVFAGRAF